MGNEITTKGNDKTDGCWRSSKGVSPPHGSRAALPIACDALNARTVAVRSYHYVFCASSPASCHTCVTARYLSLGISSRICVMAYQPPSSAQKERTRFAYDAPPFSCGHICQGASDRNEERGEHVSVRRQLSHAECEQLGNEFRFQPAPQFFIHAEMGISVLVVKLTHPCSQLVMSHISTDYTCAPCTADSALDWYFIPSSSLLGEFEQCELPPQKLIASGIPVRHQFYHRVSQESGKANAGISPAHQHILMMCGSMGCGPMEEIISYLCPQLTIEQELSVVCGTNDDLFCLLQA